MIATHDSFTYLPPVNPLWRLVSFAWRTQGRTIAEQRGDGVGYFDLRVVREKGQWRPAHGLVTLRGRFDALLEETGGRPFRLILERGDKEAEDAFRRLAYGLAATNRPLHTAVIKNGWRTVHHDEALDLPARDMSFVPFHSDRFRWSELWAFLKHPSWPRRWARQHNGEVSAEERADAGCRVYMDYYEEPK